MAGVAASVIQSANVSKNKRLHHVKDVDIEKSGKFKYILVKVHDPDEDRMFKHIVRGYGSCDYHADIYEKVTPEIETTGLDCECVGGGWLTHDKSKKIIHIFGESQAYGPADHRITRYLLEKKFPPYTVSITNS